MKSLIPVDKQKEVYETINQYMVYNDSFISHFEEWCPELRQIWTNSSATCWQRSCSENS